MRIANISSEGVIYKEAPDYEQASDKAAELHATIAECQAQLQASDYKVIKCAEAMAMGESLPYDIEELHSERQALRERINQAEEELDILNQ